MTEHALAGGRSDPAPVPAGQRPGRHRRVPRRLRHARAEQSAPRRRRGRRRERGRSASAAARARARRRPPAAASGTLRFANWIGYIDIDRGRLATRPSRSSRPRPASPSTTSRRIDGNETFFTSDLQGPLEAGLPTEWDLVVVTDWMVARLVRLGWLETIDTSLTPELRRPTSPTTTRAARSTRTPTSRRRGSRA